MADFFNPPARKAVMFRTHFWDESCTRMFTALQESLGDSYDVIATGFLPGPEPLAIPPGVNQVFHDLPALHGLPYPDVAALDPHQYEPMAFFHKYRDYSHYWLIEYDVRYTGDWRTLFESLDASNADFLATVVRRRRQSPLWAHWQEFCARQPNLPEPHYVKAFAPLMRLSNAGMRAVDAKYRAGWGGFYEALWPSAVAAAGLTIEDIGGDGPFTPPARRGAFYTANAEDPHLVPGSFVFRPSMLEQDIPASPALLWHPVKPAHMQTPLPPARPRSWRDHAYLRPVRALRHWLTSRKTPYF